MLWHVWSEKVKRGIGEPRPLRFGRFGDGEPRHGREPLHAQTEHFERAFPLLPVFKQTLSYKEHTVFEHEYLTCGGGGAFSVSLSVLAQCDDVFVCLWSSQAHAVWILAAHAHYTMSMGIVHGELFFKEKKQKKTLATFGFKNKMTKRLCPQILP